MKTVLRWMACALLAGVAFPAVALGPMTNGTGDGEANVPFDVQAAPASDEIGGGAGEPGRTEAAKDAATRAREEAAAAEAWADFERHVWTDP